MAKGICSFPGCEEPHNARGWCGMHYQRWRRTGDPSMVVKPRRSAWAPRGTSVKERFWARVDKNGPLPERRPDLGACWLWTGAKNHRGYGYITVVHGTNILVHRFAYRDLIGPVPEGLVFDHLCAVVTCVKVIADESGPAHLEPVTQRENVLRGLSLSAIRAAQTHCKRGHEFTPENTYCVPSRPTSRRCRQCRVECRLAARQVCTPTH